MWRAKRLSIVSCNGAGKTFVLAIAVILYMLCFPPAIVVTTAGSWTQVRRQLWKEIHRWHSLLPAAYRHPELNVTDWEVTPEWYALGVSTNNAGLFEGYHGPHIMVIVDEAKSVDTSIFDAINRIFAGQGDVRCIQASSPGPPAGPHYQSHHSKAESWTRLKVNPVEALLWRPGGERLEMPGTARLTEEYLEDMAREYGETSALYLSMCMAEWTDAGERQLFTLAMLSDMERPLPPEEERQTLGLYMGVDVARGGDDENAIVVTEDYRDLVLEADEETGPLTYTGLLALRAFHSDDVTVLQDEVRELAREYNVPRDHIRIDAGGIGGGVVDNLNRMGWSVQGVMFGAGSDLEVPRCADLISEIWWKASRKGKAGRLAGVTDPRLRSQLHNRKYYYDQKDELKVEPKPRARTRLAREQPGLSWKSHDRADAYLLASYRGDSTTLSTAAAKLLTEKPEAPAFRVSNPDSFRVGRR